MSVVPDFNPGPKVRLPTPETAFGKLDNAMKARSGEVRDEAVRDIRGPIPVRSGRTKASMRGTVRQNRRGYRVTVDAGERAHVVRFLQGGVGSRGGHGRIAKGKRGFIRGTGVPSGMGYPAKKVWSKGLKAARKTSRAMELQMREAWEALIAGYRG